MRGGGGLLAALVLAIRILPDSNPTGDAAALSLRILGASRGAVLVGPYSQFGWSHPGPLLFYVLAPLYWLTGFHEMSPRVTALLVNAGSLGAVLWIARRHAGPMPMILVTTTLAAFEWRADGDMMFSAWNPHVTLLPMAALLFTAAAICDRWTSLWVVMLVLASFISQSHVGFVPLAASLVSISLVRALFLMDGSRRARAALMAVATLVLLWLPPLVDQLAGHPGNLSRVLAFLSDPHAARSHGASLAYLFADSYVALFSSGMHMPTGGPATATPTPLALKAVAAILIAVTAAGAVAHARRQRFLAAFCLLLTISSLVALASVFGIRGEPADHVVFWIGVIGALAAAGAVSVLLVPVRLSVRAQGMVAAMAWSVAALLVLGSAVRLVRWERVAAREREPLRLYEAMVSDMANLHARAAVIQHTASSWEEVVGVVLIGEKRGRHLSVPDDLTRVTGTDYGARGDEDIVFTIFDPTADRDVAAALHGVRTRRVGWLAVATVARAR